MSQHVLFIVNAAPYGNENCHSALRLALALAGKDSQSKVTMFLMSDATVVALPNQAHASGSTLQEMVEMLVEMGGTVRVCRTCMQNRGLIDLPLIAGCEIGNLGELADYTLEADKVLVF